MCISFSAVANKMLLHSCVSRSWLGYVHAALSYALYLGFVVSARLLAL